MTSTAFWVLTSSFCSSSCLDVQTHRSKEVLLEISWNTLGAFPKFPKVVVDLGPICPKNLAGCWWSSTSPSRRWPLSTCDANQVSWCQLFYSWELLGMAWTKRNLNFPRKNRSVVINKHLGATSYPRKIHVCSARLSSWYEDQDVLFERHALRARADGDPSFRPFAFRKFPHFDVDFGGFFFGFVFKCRCFFVLFSILIDRNTAQKGTWKHGLCFPGLESWKNVMLLSGMKQTLKTDQELLGSSN